MSEGQSNPFSLAIAVQMQVVGLLATAWISGEWLNEHHPKEFNWYLVTFSIGVIAIIQTLYKMYIYIKRKTGHVK